MTTRKIKQRNIHPQRWCTGRDLLTHLQYRAWVSQRNQAIYRREGWSITFDQFRELWTGRWEQRGRAAQALLLTRINWAEPWSVTNVEIITRQEHAVRQGAHRAAGRRSTARAQAQKNA